jgi:hypothetical protein
VFSMLIVKVSKFRRSAETGKCSDFYLGQRNEGIFVGEIETPLFLWIFARSKSRHHHSRGHIAVLDKHKQNLIQHSQQERFVDADALAEHLSIARRQILEMTRRGIIPGHPLGVGRSRKVWRYKISEVESAIASGARKPSCESDNDSLARPSNEVTIRPGSSPSQRRKSNG